MSPSEIAKVAADAREQGYRRFEAERDALKAALAEAQRERDEARARYEDFRAAYTSERENIADEEARIACTEREAALARSAMLREHCEHGPRCGREQALEDYSKGLRSHPGDANEECDCYLAAPDAGVAEWLEGVRQAAKDEERARLIALLKPGAQYTNVPFDFSQALGEHNRAVVERFKSEPKTKALLEFNARNLERLMEKTRAEALEEAARVVAEHPGDEDGRPTQTALADAVRALRTTEVI